MNWGNPFAWWLLSLAPLIILLHALRRRRRVASVTALFLWEEALRERRSRFSLRRLRQNAQLLLQLLVLLLLTAALAEPQWRRETRITGNVVVVIDASASMRATGPRGSRFTQARRAAAKILNDLPDGARMAIITAAARPVLRSFFTADRDRLRKTLDTLQATDEPGALRPALLMALNLAQRGRGDEVVLISDGADDLPDDLDPGRTRMRLVQVTGGRRNVGITRFAFRQEPGSAGSVQLFLEVRNFGSLPAQAKLSVGFDGRAAHTLSLDLPEQARRTIVLPVSQTNAEEAYARLDVDDDFATDNIVRAILSSAEDTWVLVVGERNYFLRQVLGSLPNVLLNHVANVSPERFARQVRGHHLIIFDRVTPPPLPVGTFLLINTLPPNLPWKASGIVEQPRVGGWNADHPVLRHVNLNEVHIARSLNFEAPVESRLASDMRGRPLITLYDDGSLRFVQLGFDLMETDLPLRVAFPIFMSNVLRWANPNSLRFSAKMVQTGEAALLAIPPNATSLTLLRPDGERQRLAVQDQLNLRYEATNRAGIYRWQAGKRLRAFAANLLDPRESDIAPKSHPAWTQPHAVIGAGVVHTTSRAYWYALLLFAVLALCVEWWVWCREG